MRANIEGGGIGGNAKGGSTMRRKVMQVMRAAAAAALVSMVPVVAPAQTLENPPSFSAAQAEQIAGIPAKGENYTVESPVRSDGMLRIYRLATPYGEFIVHGDDMMRMRVNELTALAALEKVSNSKAFGDALVQAGLSPVKYTGRLITDPVNTVQDTLSGVGAFFDRLGAGLANQGQTQDKPMESLLGVTDERRKIAASYGVDPYTDFPPLDAKLKQLAEAATAGGLVVSGALMAVPGAAGIVVSNLSTAYKLNDIGLEELARSYTAAQIVNLNRGRLIEMGIPPAAYERLLANHDFTPIDMAAMVAALESMKGVGEREVFVARAAEAHPRYVAYFVRRQAELMAADYRKRRDYRRFVSLAGDPVLFTRKGRFATVVPIDILSWTQDSSGTLTKMTNAGREMAPKARGELRISGKATALAKRSLKKDGWSVVEGLKY